MGGKKGGSSHTPVEAKETGRSFQIARILDVLSEPPKLRKPIPIDEFYEPMVECKKMKARVRESYCGMHPCCKGCGREFSNAFK